jgi:uncharacterized membrane protein YoaK (UPF0700 family)
MAGIHSWKQSIAPADIALAALASASGMMDVASFLALGNVFTSAMTGNTALLGIALTQGRMSSAAHSSAALVGFMAGASFAAAIALQMRSQRYRELEVIRPLLLAEILCLAAFAVLSSLAGGPGETVVLYWLILLSAVGMGIQGVAARCLNSPGINTIVFTSTLISIVTSLTTAVTRWPAAGGIDPDTKRQIAMLFAYAFGAVLAGLLIGPALLILAWIPLAALLIGFACCEAAATADRNSG